MASPFLNNKAFFRHAHELIRQEFAAPEVFAWFRASREGEVEEQPWVAVVCQRGVLRGASVSLGGMMRMDTDGIVINGHKDAFPYPPQTGDVFLIGPAEVEGGTTPAADLPQYVVL